MMHAVSTPELGTADLVRRATEDSMDLVRLEIALARDELQQDLLAARTTAICAGAGVACALVGIAALVISLGVALGPLGTLAIGLGLIVTAGVLGAVAYKKLPTRPLAATTRRLETDKSMLQDRFS